MGHELVIYRQGLYPSPLNKDGFKKHVILIPGFLTEKRALNHGIHDIDDIGHLKICDWYRHFLNMPLSFNANVYYFNWPSQSIHSALQAIGKKLLSIGLNLSLGPFIPPVLQIFQSLQTPWNDAVEMADLQAKQLMEDILSLDGEVFIIGHSLGGRIATRLLEVQEQLDVKKLYIASLAPAISERELIITQKKEAIKHEIFYSKYDMILRFIFRAGESSLVPALGQVGPHHKYRNGLNGIDVSSSYFCKKMGHGDYEEHFMTMIAVRSKMWQEFMSDVYLGDRR